MKQIIIAKHNVAHWRMMIALMMILALMLATSHAFSHEHVLPNKHAILYAQAQIKDKRKIAASRLPVPRFVSVKARKANMRRGPGKQYPVIWQFRKTGLPVEIIAEYGLWRHIRDYDGAQGWMHISVLQGKRFVILHHGQGAAHKQASKQTAPSHQTDATPIALRHKAQMGSRIIALLQPGVIAALKKCNNDWCEIKLNRQNGKHTGWVSRHFLWGVYPFEFRD